MRSGSLKLPAVKLPPWSEAAAIVAVAWAASHTGLGALMSAGLPAIAALVVGARAGYAAGVAAGAAAAGLALIEAGLAPRALLAPTGARAAIPPIVLAGALGALGGLIGDAHLAARQRFRADAEQWKVRHDQLKASYDALVAAKEAQDRRVVGQFHTFTTLYEAAKALDVLEPAAVLPAVVKLAHAMLEAEAVALYTLEQDRLVLREAIGENPRRRKALPLDGTLAGLAVRSVRPRTVEPGRPAPPDGWLAAPLLARDGTVRAVILVEKLAFLRLTADTVSLLTLLADWSARALATSEEHAEARSQQLLDPLTGLHRPAYMEAQVHREWSLARRYKLPLSLMLIRQPELLALGAEDYDRRAHELAGILYQAVRQIDPIGHYRTRDAFLVILPVTPPDGAAILAGRVAQLQPGLRVSSRGNADGETAEAVLQLMQADVELAG